MIRQSYHPFFRSRAPFAVAWVDLDEGPRLLTNIVGVEDPSTELEIGQRVTVGRRELRSVFRAIHAWDCFDQFLFDRDTR